MNTQLMTTWYKYFLIIIIQFVVISLMSLWQTFLWKICINLCFLHFRSVSLIHKIFLKVFDESTEIEGVFHYLIRKLCVLWEFAKRIKLIVKLLFITVTFLKIIELSRLCIAWRPKQKSTFEESVISSNTW